MTKQEIIDSVFAIKFNTEIEKMIEVKNAIKNFFKEFGFDSEVNDAQLILRMFENEAEYNKEPYAIFKESCKMLEPITKRLRLLDEWSKYEIKIAPYVIGYCANYKHSIDLAKKMLKQLKKFSDEKDYVNIKLAVHTNMLLRLLRAKLVEVSDKNDPKLKAEFLKHRKSASKICEANFENCFLHSMLISMRAAVF